MTAQQKNRNPKNEKLDFLDEIKESTYFQWVTENGRLLGYGLLTLLLIIIAAFKFMVGSTERTESNYVQAENTFALLLKSLRDQKGNTDIATTINQLKEVTNSSPELHSKYDGIIAQLLLVQDNPDAKAFAQRTLDRTSKDNLPLYTQFTQTSLKIADKDYTQALAEAKTLRSNLENKDFGNSLYTYNVLRIAMLEKEAGTPEGEKIAWEEWKSLASNPNYADAQKALQKELEEGSFTLAQFIELREKDINLKLKK